VYTTTRSHPWANHGPVAPPSSDELLHKARMGGRAVAAAVAAANRVGDANEIELPADSDADEDNDNNDRGEVGAAVAAVGATVDPAEIDLGGWGGSDEDEETADDPKPPAGEGPLAGEEAAPAVAKRKQKAVDEVPPGVKSKPTTRVEPEPAAEPPRKKPKRVFTGSGASMFIKRWAWKREAKSDEERFVLPYVHSMTVRRPDGSIHARTLNLRQTRFEDGASGGFASTAGHRHHAGPRAR